MGQCKFQLPVLTTPGERELFARPLVSCAQAGLWSPWLCDDFFCRAVSAIEGGQAQHEPRPHA
jgi:hypothetical protein